jgi:hypothetical protein
MAAVVTMIALGFAAEVAKRQERTNGVVRRILGTIRFHTPRDPDEAHAHGRRALPTPRSPISSSLPHPVGFFLPETQKYVVLARRLCEQGGVFCDVERLAHLEVTV